MNNRSNEFDEIFIQTPRGASGGAANGGNNNPAAMDDIIAQNKAQVRQVTNIMEENMRRALERDENIADVGRRTAELEEGANQFQTMSNKAKNHYLCQNRKWTIILIATIAMVIVLVGLGVLLLVQYNKSGSG